MSDTHATLKHWISVLEVENNQLLVKVVKKLWVFFPPVIMGSALELMACTFHSINNCHLEGQAICQLINLAIPLSELISEHDRHVELGAEDEVSTNVIQGSIEYMPLFYYFSTWTVLNLCYVMSWRENYIYRSFKKLICWCPSVKKFLDDEMNSCDAALAFQEVWLTYYSIEFLQRTHIWCFWSSGRVEMEHGEMMPIHWNWLSWIGWMRHHCAQNPFSAPPTSQEGAFITMQLVNFFVQSTMIGWMFCTCHWSVCLSVATTNNGQQHSVCNSWIPP